MSEMVNTPPWSRLPLRICWLIPTYKMELSPPPPSHMPITVGYISATSTSSKNVKPEPIPTVIPERISESSAESDDSEDQPNIDESFLTLADKIKARKRRKTPNIKKPTKKRTTKRHSVIGTCCEVCGDDVGNEGVKCLSNYCPALTHLICLAKFSTRNEVNQLIPIKVECPNCHLTGAWGDLVRQKNQMNSYIVPNPGADTCDILIT